MRFAHPMRQRIIEQMDKGEPSGVPKMSLLLRGEDTIDGLNSVSQKPLNPQAVVVAT
jgi:hypothetical protein